MDGQIQSKPESAPSQTPTGKAKRKKASRACQHCQKAHLTCDDERPCKRCVKRGLDATCQDGQRKKAKYLQDLAEAVTTPTSGAQAVANTPSTHSYGHSVSPAPHEAALFPAAGYPKAEVLSIPGENSQQGNTNPYQQNNMSTSFQPDFTFGSQAANLEYDALSSMLNGHSSFKNPAASDLTLSSSPFDSLQTGRTGTSTGTYNSYHSNALPLASLPLSQASSFTAALPSFNFASVDGKQGESTANVRTPCGAMNASDVYNTIDKPYSHASSYHDLIRHLKQNFSKSDILRIIRAIAVFRPSIMALQMPLTQEDEVFIEKCCQRTLIELEKLIALTGTPTVVWRRTGEICLVGVEFAQLTHRSQQDLVCNKKKRFIFELLDQKSVVDYYEAFAKHAFENATQAVILSVVLLTPDKQKIPCSFSFTIKRDLFSCPSLIIGSFLPTQ